MDVRMKLVLHYCRPVVTQWAGDANPQNAALLVESCIALPSNSLSFPVYKTIVALSCRYQHVSWEGLPYAPVDWQCPGDNWGLMVGKRKNASGFMRDMYLYPSNCLQNNTSLAPRSTSCPPKERAGNIGSELNAGTKVCKAGNKMCTSLHEATNNNYSQNAMDCDICCSEDGFCRDCCCILCSRTISFAYGGYSFIRCEAKVNESYICGHVAHINCALRSYMAGTVGGSIGLDMQYYCRRCDHRTDLTSHVTKLLKSCETLNSRDDIATILKVGLCLLRGSQQEFAKRLLSFIDLALKKLKGGDNLKDIWNADDNISVVAAGAMNEASSLEKAVEQVLIGLKKAQ
ncbi:hypothetical protein GIB67_001195 [Kingdonia uniflora]|uniref:Oberon PHD finger domain-containing protein n=1 Tax=Kingdonia uniflora TaxID=39325 RepID=A0A7J7LG90_9MAGN|nr:hypothetical protein GIB67_001195 [Kingdonia uniflora]